MIEVVDSSASEDKLNEIYRFRYQIYQEELNYLKQDMVQTTKAMESDEYDMDSKHIILRQENKIMAYARIIEDKGKGLLILNKIHRPELLADDKRVEVSRLMVTREFRYSKAIVMMFQAIYHTLMQLECTYIVADTFRESNNYRSLKMIGFQELVQQYEDESFNSSVKSAVLYIRKEDLTREWNKFIKGKRA